MTTQAMALNDAYRASGAPTAHPRRSYRKRADKAYSVKTNKTWHTYEGRRFFEYGDAVLHADSMPRQTAIDAAEYLASCGFHAVVFPNTIDYGMASLMATTEYRERGQVRIYNKEFTWQGANVYRVTLNDERRAAAWARANAV